MTSANRSQLWFVARPMGPLFFGDTRPNQAGELHHAWSRFPPPVRAWQGLLRTHLLRAVRPALDLNDHSRVARERCKELVGSAHRLPRGWQIHGAMPAELCAEDGEAGEPAWLPWLPMPAMTLKEKRKEQPDCLRYPRPLPDRQGGLPENQPLLGRPDLDCRAAGGWCSARTLLALLGGELEGKPLKSLEWTPDVRPPFVREETQSGLALDNRAGRSANAMNGMLYFQRQLRLDDGCGFIGGIEGALPEGLDPSALSQAQATWGRKARPVALETTERLASAWRALQSGEHLGDFRNAVDEQDCFWLITLTPVALDEPTHPQPRLEDFPGVRFITEGAIAGRPVTVGGFDMARGEPLENQAMLPAGASWLFRLEGGDGQTRAAALRALNNGFRLGHPHQAAFGYGQTLVGLYLSKFTGD